MSSIRCGQGGCWPCGRRKADATMRHDADEAVTAMRRAGLEPLEPHPGTAKPWRSRCTRCDAEVAPRLASINPAVHAGSLHVERDGIELVLGALKDIHAPGTLGMFVVAVLLVVAAHLVRAG